MVTKLCPQCNKLFETECKTQIFCSRRCKGDSESKKVKLTCPRCGKEVYVHKGTKFCSKACADAARRGIRLIPVTMKTCPVCNKLFESKYPEHKFCSRNCAEKGLFRPSKHNLTEEGRLAQSNRLKMQWQYEEFRNLVVTRMKTHNPVYMPGVIEKANATRAKHGIPNNFKYGNGKISPYEQLVKDKLESLGFIYNHAIPTKAAREADPNAHYAVNYKPDFVNLENKLCIEIDGAGHSSPKEKSIDVKKEKCLNFLGYSVIRFTHCEIDEGVFDQWLNSYQESI